MPEAVAAAGVDADAGDRHRHRLHRLHRAAGARRRHAAVRAARVRRPAARLREALEAPRGPAARPTGSTRSPTSAASRGSRRYGGKLSSEWEFAKGLQLLEEDPELYAPDRPLDRGGRLDRVAAVRRVRPQRLHRRLQGRSTRTAPTRPVDYLAALHPDFGRLRRGQARGPDRRRSAGSPGGSPPRPRPGPGCPRASRSRRQRRRARHRAGRAGGRARPDGGDHGHLDLPRDERATELARGPGHVRGGRRRHRPRAVGLRGRPERRRRHLRLVRRHACRPRTRRRPTRAVGARAPDASWPPRSRSARTASSRWTGTTATARCWSTTTCPGCSSA